MKADIKAPNWFLSAIDRLGINLHEVKPCPFCGSTELELKSFDDEGGELTDWLIPNWYEELNELESDNDPEKEDYDRLMTEELARELLIVSSWAGVSCKCGGALSGFIKDPDSYNHVIDLWNNRGGA